MSCFTDTSSSTTARSGALPEVVAAAEGSYDPNVSRALAQTKPGGRRRGRQVCTCDGTGVKKRALQRRINQRKGRWKWKDEWRGGIRPALIPLGLMGFPQV